MKKNEKVKKITAKKTTSVAKSAAKTTSSKSTAKKTTKTIAKPTAKKVATKTAVKAVKKVTPAKKATAKVKPQAKATPKKVVPTKTAVKSTVKTVKKTTVKTAPIKAAPKKATITKKATTPVKISAKTKKTAATPAKAPIKATAKTPVKTAAPKVTAKTKKTSSVKTTAVKTTTKAKAPAKITAKSPIIVKTPQNQNMPSLSTGSTKTIVTMVPQKLPTSISTTSLASTKPAYRPIQVINKPLAPLQPVRQMAPISKEAEKIEFNKGDYVCYPAHGVGEIEAVETQTIGGMEIKLYAIAFEKDRMRLKVPVSKAHASGLRRLSSSGRMEDALKTLQGRAHVRRAMWSRRAQEYETKINSGDPVSIAEVLRDLKRSNDDTEQSYSERQIYQSALERLAREVAAVEKISEEAAAERLENMIKGRKARSSTEKTENKEQAA